jgi:ABC-type amino acid transport substrate-binding protein
MKISLIMTAVLLTVGVTSTASAQTLKKIADSGRISVSYREASVPFSYVIGVNKAVGFSVDISEAIIDDVRKAVKNPKLEVTYTPVTSVNRIPLLQNGTIDLECGSTTNNSTRGKDVQFAINHFYTGTRLLTKVNSGVKDWAGLSQKTLATTSGTTNAAVVRKLGRERNIDMQVLMGKDHDESLLLVESDRAVAFAMDDILLFGLRANSKSPESLQVVGESVQVEPYACMLRKDDPEFKALVDGAITKLMKSGEFTKLYTKWFESPIVPKGINLKLPMSQQLKDNIKALSDKPAI